MVNSTEGVIFLAQESKPKESLPNRTMRYTQRSGTAARQWQSDLRDKLSALLKIDDLVAQRRAIFLDPREASVSEKGKYLLHDLTIQSTPGRRIPVALAIPKSGDGPFPAVVCIHGHGGSRFSPFDPQAQENAHIYKAFGAALAERGFVCISTEVGQHEVYEAGRTLMGERLWDVTRCVDYLESLDAPKIHRSRIGCAGLSLGGEMAMWLGAMDTRVAAVGSAGFLTNMDHMEKNHCMCWKLDGLRNLADWADIYSLIAPRPLQCQNGLNEPPPDFIVPLAQVAMAEIQTIYRDFHAADNAVLDIHPGAHEIDLPGLLAFLEAHLHASKH
ncbi:MAG: hypothetical protein HY706_02810 [Candidatus Hydrogenedentes bacterium]|nr:hypothetical protein [Candidatus Hydrogenedentota bacterium]